VTEIAIKVVAHADLASSDLEGLRRLFDAEYLSDFGEWDPDMPYGYAPHAVHVVARSNGEVFGSVGAGQGGRSASATMRSRSLDRLGQPGDDPPGQPLLVLPVEDEIAAWSTGTVDLRGRAW